LVVREVDAVFSLGVLARRRSELLAELRSAGLYDRNRERTLPALPLSVGLVTSAESAAYQDFVSSLRQSGYGFRVVLVPTTVQGRDASAGVAGAIGALARCDLDCIAVIRGGGARSDLAAFDSRAVALAIVESRLPVLTGLGHETDRSVADEVAHACFKTPTMLAESLVQRIAAEEARLARCRQSLRLAATVHLESGRRRVDAQTARARHAAARVERQALHVENLRRRLGSSARHRIELAAERSARLRARLRAAAPRSLRAVGSIPERVGRRIADLARSRVREAELGVVAMGRLAAELAPERVLSRGFSVTRGADGRLLLDAAAVRAGEMIATRLASGSLTSRVTETHQQKGPTS
jgi:exodeoxyribonuclease VII large subunit